MDHRLRTPRAALVAGVLALALTACSNDVEKYPHTGEHDGWTQGSPARTVLLYLLVPVVIAAVISLLAWLPGAVRRHRYRPSEGWDAEPVWFAGPADPTAAVERAQTGDVVRGGAGGSW